MLTAGLAGVDPRALAARPDSISNLAAKVLTATITASVIRGAVSPRVGADALSDVVLITR